MRETKIVWKHSSETSKNFNVNGAGEWGVGAERTHYWFWERDRSDAKSCTSTVHYKKKHLIVIFLLQNAFFFCFLFLARYVCLSRSLFNQLNESDCDLVRVRQLSALHTQWRLWGVNWINMSWFSPSFKLAFHFHGQLAPLTTLDVSFAIVTLSTFHWQDI